MALTGKQKKYVKKHLRQKSLDKIAANLGVSRKEIEKYLKKRLGKEKYKKLIVQKEKKPTPEILSLNFKKLIRRSWKQFAFLSFLVLAVYANSLGNDFVSDDIGAIRDNSLINEPSLFWQPPYFRVSLVAFLIFLTNKIFGLTPTFYRLINIFFHLGSTWLVFCLLSFFFEKPLPFFTASFFAVHPILTEAVTWISGMPYSGGAFFLLLSFLTYICATKNKKPKYYLVSLASFYFSLLFSEKMIVWPIVLLLYEFSLGNLKINWRKLIPFWIISGFWGLYLFGLLGSRTATLETTHYQEPGLYNPLIQIPIAISSYLKLIFWPQKLTLYHSEMVFTRSGYHLHLGIFLSFLAAIIYFFKKERRIFFWLALFPISLSLTLTPFKIAWVVAERYVYLGTLGIFVLIASAIKKIGEVAKNQKISYVILTIILVALSARTIARNTDWKNQDTLWIAAAKTSPSSPQNHNNLGDMYARHGDLEKAVEEFKRAIELKPNYGDAYHNLANVYHQMDESNLAIENYQKAIATNPNLWQSHQNLAAIYFESGQLDLAENELNEAITINPQNTFLYTNLGIVYLELNENEKAKAAFLRALEIDPQNQKAKELLNQVGITP